MRVLAERDSVKILLLEDDRDLHESLKAYLEHEGFEVTGAFDGNDVYALTYEHRYDLYIFDVNVPGEDGFKILRSLKNADDTTPAIYITALSDVASVSSGFSAGADDYIKKPFDPEELVIRIKNRYLKCEIIAFQNIRYNPATKELSQNGQTVPLGEVQRNLLHQLIVNRNKIVENHTLYDLMEHPNPSALRVSLSKLKTRLGLEIKNVRGVGYMLETV